MKYFILYKEVFTITIDFWKIREIKLLKLKIKDLEELINKFNLELKIISKSRRITIKDFAILNHKYGNTKLNQSYIDIYKKEINYIKTHNFSCQDEYYMTGNFKPKFLKKNI